MRIGEREKLSKKLLPCAKNWQKMEASLIGEGEALV